MKKRDNVQNIINQRRNFLKSIGILFIPVFMFKSVSKKIYKKTNTNSSININISVHPDAISRKK